MTRLRLLFLGLSMSVLVWTDGWLLPQLLGQVPPAPKPAVAPPSLTPRELGQGGLNLADRSLERKLSDAKKRLNEGNNGDAARRIQELLSQPQDGFFRPAGDMSGRYLSLKREAASLLQNAPPAVRESYELQFGAEAREKLDLARSRQDVKLAQEVTQRYLYTSSGAEACYWLASQAIDQADYFTAIQYLNRLRTLSTANRFEPRLSLRMALCWYRLGTHEKALLSIRDAQNSSREPIQIGTHELSDKATNEQIQAWLRAISKGAENNPLPESSGWQMARGTPDRNPRRQSSPPVAKGLWNVAMNSWQVLNRRTLKPETIDVAPQFNSYRQIHQDAALTPLPCTIPLVVNGQVIVRYPDHLTAFDVKTGQEVWSTFERDRTFHEIRNSLGSSEKISSAYNGRTADFRDTYKILLRQRAWEDLSFGTLSSDGEYVFAIEDLGFVNSIAFETATQRPHPLAMRDYNRLCAYDVQSGMLRWELGGPNSAIKLDQAGAFFLGPPLPAGHQLYCLVEQQGFVQLLVLDSKTGQELWTQYLTQIDEELIQAPYRRRAGLTPAMMGDVLVCPTGTGYVVAVDTGNRSLAWAYRYGVGGQNPNTMNPRLMGRGFRMNNGGDPVDFNSERPAIVNEWQDASPILTDTHVILTPRDSQELHCLSLEDGAFQWRVPRGEGQYVAAIRDGMVIIVNKQGVESRHLTDGKPAWPSPIPVINQTGRGITTHTHLVLPLVSGQVVSIELKTGRKFYSRVRAADQDPLGNLVSGPGLILSQSPTELSAYRTLESVYPEALARLAKNPQDAEALAVRGEYRLSVSQIAEGQNDLRASLRVKASPDAEFLLFESLLEGLQSDFAAHRDVAPEAERLAQTLNQKSVLYRAWAGGLRKLGEFQPAFDLLIKLNRPELGRPELERVDGYHTIRRDYWIRNELRQVMVEASLKDRDQFQAVLKARLVAAHAGQNEADLRQLTRLLGWGPLAEEARLNLAEHLATKDYSLEVEHLLAGLRRSSDPKKAATATALMVAGMIKLERSSEAAGLVHELETTYADVVGYQNKTGKLLAAGWRPAVGPNPGSSDAWPTGRVELTREILEKGEQKILLEIPVEGDKGPFYGDMQTRVESGTNRFLGTTGWGAARFAMPLSELLPFVNPSVMNVQVRNHLVLLNTGMNIVAITTLTDGKTIRAQRLWSAPLVDGPSSEENQGFQVARVRPGIGRPKFQGMDRFRNPIGMLNAIEDDTVCIIRGRHLVLLDILTGETLWKRTNMIPGSEMFGDAETIFVVAPQAVVAKRIRRSDGTELGEVDVPEAQHRIQFLGDSVLSASQDPLAPTRLTIRLTNLSQGKTVWERPFAPQTQVSLVGETEMAVLEPSGLLSYLRIADGQLLWAQQLPPLVKRKDFSVFPNGKRLLVLRDENPPQNMLFPQVFAVNGMQQNLMYGMAECLDRATGKALWTHRIDHYALDLSMPMDSPVWFFSARAMAQQVAQSEIRLMAIDKRTGRVALQAAERVYGHGFEFEIDPKEKQIDITLLGSQPPIRHRLKLTEQPLPPADVAPVPVPKPPTPKP